ncbi:MAG: hypothetical protein H6825_09305 [Planctomycetes bacterium]|nr:hypothetical protein [Planctomycetota bacterium]
MSIRTILVASIGAMLATQLHADVLTVDDSGGADFTTIQAAVDAAVDGDFVFVRDGTYQAFTIDDKALTVVIDPDSTLGAVQVDGGPSSVKNLSSSRTVVLSFLRFVGAFSKPTDEHPGLVVRDCAGSVRVQACQVWGGDGKGNDPTFGEAGAPAARVTGSFDVAFLGCQFEGGIGAARECSSGAEIGGAGGPGLLVETSNVWVYDSQVVGGRGNEGCKEGGDGGHGARVLAGGSLFASNSAFVAGDGNEAIEFLCDGSPDPFWSSGDGGDALRLAAGATARTLDTALVAGQEGDVFFCGVTGDPGAPVAGAGTYLPIVGAARAMNSSKAGQEGETIGLQFKGEPGESTVLLLSLETSAVFKPAWQGVFMLGPFVGPYAVGTVPPSGVFTVSLLVPDLPPGVEGAGLFLQSAFLAPGGGVSLGSPAQLTLLDASF